MLIKQAKVLSFILTTLLYGITLYQFLIKKVEFDNQLIILLAIGSYFLLSSLFKPSLNIPLTRAWVFTGEFVRKCVATIILSIIYFLIITPFGIVLRLFNRLQYNNQNDLDTKSKKVDINYPF